VCRGLEHERCGSGGLRDEFFGEYGGAGVGSARAAVLAAGAGKLYTIEASGTMYEVATK